MNGSTYETFMEASRLVRDLLRSQGFMNGDILLIAKGDGHELRRHVSADGWIDELTEGLRTSERTTQMDVASSM
ncbi:MAG: hypothetical protein IJS50_04120 [Desulfovibrio sp.]|nr:hypothetical protein [Desulfovibrio sp.]